MSYSVYFKYGGKKYKLPVNPEEIKRSRELNIENYQVLGTGQVSVPSYYNLEEFSFEAEFPSQDYHYMNSGARADADYYEKMFRKAQKNMKPVRFIASNDITDDISVMVLVKSVEAVEKAGEEGDKYLSIKLQEYKAPGKRYVAVQTVAATVKQEDTAAAAETNPAVTENKTHTVQSGDTLWAIAKKYYGNGGQYTKIASANPDIKNPNLIYPGQVLSIPA
jgi:LysM repeat protein